MSRSKAATRSVDRSSAASSSSVVAAAASPPALPSSIVSSTLINDAETLIGQCEYARALALLLSQSAAFCKDARWHDALFECYGGLSRPQLAFTAIDTACSLSPDDSGERWMNRGQCLSGADALQSYRNAESVFRRTNRRCAVAQCLISQCELFMTDLCDEAEAETQCERALAAAVEVWPQCVDALYASANFNFIRERHDDAAHWFGLCRDALERRPQSINELTLAELGDDEEALNYQPQYALRLNIAQLAYEMSMLDDAKRIVERLVEDDGRSADALYLSALIAKEQKQWTNALTHIDDAIDILDQEIADAQPTREPQQSDDLRSALIELRQELHTHTMTDESDHDDGAGDAEEGDDDSDDELMHIDSE